MLFDSPFERGTRVKVVSTRTSTGFLGRTGTLNYFNDAGEGKYWDISLDQGGSALVYESDLEIIKTNKNNMSLKKSFQNIFLKEPEKSFRKAGITDGDGSLTTDGQAVLLSWLLQKHGEEFKTAVVDPILAEQKEN